MKSMAGGDMFIRDKKTDTKDTRDRKSTMRNKARGDFAKKKTQQTLNLGKSALKNRSVDNVTDDGPSGNLEGSSEIVRGKRA